MGRRLDPEPITIYLAAMATLSLGIAAANYAKTHFKPLPSQVRRTVISLLTEVEDHAKYLQTDLRVLQDIFAKAHFSGGRTIRLGNGALLNAEEFSRYETVADKLLRRLRDLNKTCLKLERQAARLDSLELGGTAKRLGEAHERFEKLLASRDLSVDRAWAELRAIAQALEGAISDLRKQLSVD
jgi:hypothetical protein